MGFVIYVEGEPVAGDNVLDSNLRARADRDGGIIKDDSTGEVVYTPEGVTS